jgi:hypothetical protein
VNHRWRAELLTGAAVLLLLVPWLSKPPAIDDYLFLRTAQQLLERPLDFYGFDVNWYGDTQPMWQVTKNPPLGAVPLALAGALFGFDPIPLHAVMLVPAVLAGIAAVRLARLLDLPPAWVGLTAVTMPAFAVTASSLMAESTLLALMLWAIVWWIDGRQRNAPARLIVGGLLAGLAVLTKFSALFLIPLFALDLGIALALAWARSRAGGVEVSGAVTEGLRTPGLIGAVAGIALATALVAGYDAFFAARYGFHPLADAASYSAMVRTKLPPAGFVVGLIFLGGVVLPLLPVGLALGRVRAWLAFLTLAPIVTLVATVLLRPPPELERSVTISFQSALHVALMLSAALAFAGLLTVDGVRTRGWTRGADGPLIVGLVAVTFLFGAVLNWTVNVRSLLPLAPLAVVIAARSLFGTRREREDLSNPSRSAAPRPVPIGWWCVPAFGAIVSTAVTHGDVALARAQVDLASVALERAERFQRSAAAKDDADGSSRNNVRFAGHWGFQWWLESRGVTPMQLSGRPEPGLVYLVPNPKINTNSFDTRRHPGLELIEELTVPVRSFVAVMDDELRAGLHSHIDGPLPYRLGRPAPLSVRVVRSKADP